MLNLTLGFWLVTVGAVMLAHVVRQMWLARVSRNWPVVEAHVLETRVDVRRRRLGLAYVPVLRYQYRCGDLILDGDRIIFSGQSVAAGSQEEARHFVGQFRVGMPVSIRVCPTRATLSVIEPGFDSRWWVPLVFALAFVLVGLTVVIEPTNTR